MIKLDELLENIDFEDFFESFNNSISFCQLVNRCEQYDIKYRYGATKFVIIDTENVYKIPFQYDEFGDPFEGILDDDDYCRIEADLSKSSDIKIPNGVLPLAKLENIKSVNIYQQIRATEYLDKFPTDEFSPTVDSLLVNKYHKYKAFCDFPHIWVKDYLLVYGITAFDTLLKFIDYHGINDLDKRNIGYTQDNKPCIFDYSGYYG